MKRTEQRNEKSMNIDKMSASEIVKLMNDEDKTVAYAVEKALPEIAAAVEQIVRSFERGGRLLYIGAGTSGRLGVLDASECPPTYGVPSSMVVGIIAGGYRTLTSAAENAEDNAANGKIDVQNANICEKDTIVGISVAGDAEYVYSALAYAKEAGAATVALTCNADAKIATIADITILTDTGAEAVTGSTRLKAGTAHKMVLNMLTTAAMVKTGKVVENLMINVAPTNVKLRDRCIRIVRELTDLTYEQAAEKIDRGMSIKEIIEETGI
ncbi:MAG: N-acetylmuramic acid 6-phosphate etherase [Clostridia bacterium]|nr:N-acetylmuramic acid 6-phosphate etherase [Clostridia bacterium]